MRVQRLRLFWAVNLPPDIKRKLDNLQAYLQTTQVNIKWVEQQNLHLTVKFLGEVDGNWVSEISQVVKQKVAGTGSFELLLSGLGFFPGARHPKVVWLGVDGEVDKFHLLHRRVEEGLAALGWAMDNQNFAPHLTLGRLRALQASEVLVSKVDEVRKNWSAISIAVSSIELMKSQLTPKGPIYHVLESIKLNAGEGII